MKKNNLSKKVLKEIKEKRIKPKPKWEFLLKDYAIWITSILFLIVGSLAFSVVIFLVRSNDWAIYDKINDSILSFVFLTLPYFWLLFLILFVFLAYYNFKHTRKGYKYKVVIVGVSIILLTLILGAFLYCFGVGHFVDRILSERLPFYGPFFNRQRMIWRAPQAGRLGGTIISVQAKNDFELKALDQRVWRVWGEDILILPDSEVIKVGERVKVIGSSHPDNSFEAVLVLPFAPRPGFFRTNPKIREGLRNHPEIFERIKGQQRLRRPPKPLPQPPVLPERKMFDLRNNR